MDPLPAGKVREGPLYPNGGHLKDLRQVRDLLYQIQRPGIAPVVSDFVPCSTHFIQSSLLFIVDIPS